MQVTDLDKFMFEHKLLITEYILTQPEIGCNKWLYYHIHEGLQTEVKNILLAAEKVVAFEVFECGFSCKLAPLHTSATRK